MIAKLLTTSAFVVLITAALAAQTPNLPLPDLAGGLKATPGCLGVEQARTSSGKLVIFAWFEDKKAALRWYNSAMHQSMVRMSGAPTDPTHVPLAGVADDNGPIMAIASLTPTDPASSKVAGLPVSQIAIELYQPLPGGVFVGSRFAPGTVKVPGLRDFTPAAAK